MMLVVWALLAYSIAPLLLIAGLAMHLADWASQRDARRKVPYAVKPVCRSCRYDLRGSMAEASMGGETGERRRHGRICPECGCELDDAHVLWEAEGSLPRWWRVRQAGALVLALLPLAVAVLVALTWNNVTMQAAAQFVAGPLGFGVLLAGGGLIVLIHVRSVVVAGMCVDAPRSERFSSNLFAVAMSIDAALVMMAFTLAGFLALTEG